MVFKIKKFFKLFLILMSILIPGIILSGLATLFLVDKNHFKPHIIHLVEKKLDRRLVIDGDFSLQFYPYIAINFKEAHLKNPEAFGALSHDDFAYIDTITLKIDVLPLLKGNIHIDKLVLKGLKLNLMRKTPTQDNWSDLVTNIKALKKEDPEDTNKNKEENENGDLSKGKFKLKLHETLIQEAELLYQDKSVQKNYQLKNLNFQTQKLDLNQPTQINGDFTFIANNMRSQMAYAGQMQFNAETNQLDLTPLQLKSTLYSTKFPNGKLINDLSVSLKADWKKQSFALENITLKFNDSVAKGSGHLDFSAGLSARFMLNFNRLKIDDYLPDTHLTLTQVHTQGLFNNNILTLSALTADLYQGHFNGSSRIVFGKSNQYHLNGQFKQVNIQTLLSSLKNIHNISGTTYATLNLATSGHTGAELKRYLTGNVSIDMRQGYLYGLDVAYYLNKAQMLAKKLPAETTLIDNKKTPFTQLKGHFIFQEGIVSNQDLEGFSDFYTLNGTGAIDLIKEQLSYRLKGLKLKDNGVTSKIPLAVFISGAWSHPKITPDIETYIQTLLQNQLEKKFGIPLPGSTNGKTDDNSSTHKKALQQELINKGLQKLFGR